MLTIPTTDLVYLYDFSSLQLNDGDLVSAVSDLQGANPLSQSNQSYKPIFKLNQTPNGKSAIRFDGINDLLTQTNSASFKHLFILLSLTGASFASYDGIWTGSSQEGLIGSPGNTTWFNYGYTVIKDGVSTNQAPFGSFALIEATNGAAGWNFTGQIGADRNFNGSRNLKGDVACVFAYANIQTGQTLTDIRNSVNNYYIAQPLIANFTTPTSINLGQNLSVSDTTTGGLGNKSRVWKINGVAVPSANNQTNPTFTGITADCTVTLEVTDDSGTDTETKTVLVNQITGSSLVAHGAVTNFTTNISNPVWSIVSGDGSINQAGQYTAPNSGAGLITIRAEQSGNANLYATKQVELQTRILTASPLSGVLGNSASGSFSADGGSGAGTFSKLSGNYPTGVSVGSNGAISGNLSAIGSFSFRLRYVDANNASNNVEKDFIWNVMEAQPLNYGFSSKEVELFCEASNLALANGANVTSFTDQSVYARHLTAPNVYPVNITNAINGKSVVRFNNSTPLGNNAQFTLRCGWILAKYNGAVFPNNADGYKGLLTDLTNNPILIGMINSNEFYDAGVNYYEFRLNDRIYSEGDDGMLHAPAPMNAYKLIFFRFWEPLVNGIQLGQDRGYTTRRWDGDVALLILTSRDFVEEEIREKSEAIAAAYGLSLADVYPYQPDWDGTDETSIQTINTYDPPEGSRLVEVIDESKQILNLKFSNADQNEINEMKKFHKNHFAAALPFLFRDYRFTPPRDVEGYFNSHYKLDGRTNDWNYSFEFQEK